LSPTLAASIAMESAVAMARAVIPEAVEDAGVGATAVTAPIAAAAPTAAATPSDRVAPASRRASAQPESPPRARKSRRRNSDTRDAVSAAPSIGVLVARIPPAARLVTMASVAFMTFAGVMYESGGRTEPESPREVRQLVAASASQDQSPFSAPIASETSSVEDLAAVNETSQPAPAAAPAQPFEETPDDPPLAYTPPPPSDGGMEEGVMRDDFGQPLRE
jgi:hypothetical protein